jgi:cytochrome c-type biogenesis protein CcmH
VTRLVAAVLAVCALLAPMSAFGLSVGEVAAELRCVTCGTPLDVSNAPAAERMKARIEVRIGEGATKQQIIDEFVADFGRQVLATPPKRGFDLVAWLLPAVAVVAGLCAIPFVTRAWAKRRPVAASTAGPLDDEDAARLERELDAFGDG